ncbi:MAG: hypothetical protein OEW48_15850 [Phycisphaerae bacterium]|nr:hypothetical protein [Phycisphaerae bacterium]
MDGDDVEPSGTLEKLRYLPGDLIPHVTNDERRRRCGVSRTRSPADDLGRRRNLPLCRPR